MCVDNLPDFPLEKSKNRKEEDAERSFWDLLDIKATIYHSLAPHIKQYNDNLPSRKGKLRRGESAVAKVLLHLMALEMERMRKEVPRNYAYYLSNEIDCFPVSTNRGQLRTMLDNHYCKSTLSSYLIRLQACGIIKRKINTSRSREIYVDENGKKQSRIIHLESGRGDIIYFINKDLLVKRISYVEIQTLGNSQSPIGKFSSIDNQPVIRPESENSEQPLSFCQRKTLKIKENKKGDCGESEDYRKATPLSLLLPSAPAGGQESEGHKKSKSCLPTFSATIKENPGGAHKIGSFFEEILKGREKKEVLPDLAEIKRKRQYFLSIEYEQRFTNRLPPEGEAYYVFLLCEQIKYLLYPKVELNIWEQQDVQIRTLLALHLRRLTNNLKDNYLQLSRAVYMVHKHLQRHEKSYIYGVLTWLRLDDKMKGGTLKKVVDDWVPRERRLLQTKFSKDMKFLTWQKITVRSEMMFANLSSSLRQGLLNTLENVKMNKEALQEMCREHGLPLEEEEQIVNDFEEKCVSVLSGMTDQGMKHRVPSLKELYTPIKRKDDRKKAWEKIIKNLPKIKEKEKHQGRNDA